MTDWITLGTTLAADTSTRVPWNSDDMVKIIAICGGLAVGAIAIVGGLIYSAYKTREIERSKRELAAYVAEGTMTAEQAALILANGLDEDERPTLGVSFGVGVGKGSRETPKGDVARA